MLDVVLLLLVVVTKPDRGKTRTIKDRAIYVYLPSMEMVEDWKRRAEKAEVSLSKFVIERVEESIRREEGEEGYLSRAELIKRLRDAEEELKKLRNENRLLKKLAENLRARADPSDTNLVKAVNKQLEALEAYGLVEYKGRGWKWKS
jgi:predicted transcriptional regulator